MTNYNATLLLARTPSDERLAQIAQKVAEEHFPNLEYEYTITHILPEGLPVDVADQLDAQQRDKPESVFLVIRPLKNE